MIKRENRPALLAISSWEIIRNELLRDESDVYLDQQIQEIDHLFKELIKDELYGKSIN